MSEAPNHSIPYEKQGDLQNGRLCGAAALSMVYRSFGKAVAQAEVWPQIAKRNRQGSLTAATHLIARDALNRGFAAVALQAASPLLLLRLCRDNGIRVILNHRLKADAAAGHFTVLVDLDAEHALLHDPYLGPSRRVPYAELLELWRPRYLNTEIAGNMLIAIALGPAAVTSCRLCNSPVPPHVRCPECGEPVPLQPAAVLGCTAAGCPARLWNYLCCPFCDYTWDLGAQPSRPQRPADAPERSVDLMPLFAELDKFCDHILSLGAAANHPDVRKQLDFIKAGKDKLKLAQSEELVYRRMHQAQLAQLAQKSQREGEAFQKRQEEINKPAPPLDGNTLGQALLKDLGLLGSEATRAEPAVAASKPGRSPAPRPGKLQWPEREEELLAFLRQRGLWR